MDWESVFDWIKGYPPSLLGLVYRLGVVVFGGVTFLIAWLVSTVVAGFYGFLIGWFPSALAGTIVGFLWPILAVVAAVAGAIGWWVRYGQHY